MLKGVRSAHNKRTALDFRKTNFSLFRDLLGKVHGIKPWREKRPKKAG